MRKKLHIGSGEVYLPEWENVDMFSTFKADCYASVLSLPYDRGSFEIIYASHVLEHLNRNMTLSALTHWKSLLKPMGILRLAVPDFSAICDQYMKKGNLSELMGLLYGGQKFILDNHNIVFDAKLLEEYLLQVGFKDVRPWQWRNTEHAEYDDYSQAYLPHLEKNSGRSMSLNMEAVKK